MEQRDLIGVGIIGLGARGLYSIARVMAETVAETGFRVTAICDRNALRLKEAFGVIQHRYAAQGVEVAPRPYESGLDLIADSDVDLIVVTSTTDTHREFAIPALQSGKCVYCDKPLAHTVEDAVAIVEAEAEAQRPLIMGFTRRYESAWLRAYELLRQDLIGSLVMLQVRDILPYHRYLTAWWRRRAWSGGALNDKSCHLFDVFNWFTGSRATQVHGFGGRSMIEADPQAPPRCHLCHRECPYRRREPETAFPSEPDLVTHFGPSWLEESEEKFVDDICVYAPGSDVYHNASIHFSYASGVVASYFYTILGPPAEDQETLELVGTKGRLILTRQTGQLDVVTDHGQTHRMFDCRGDNFEDSHFGADIALVKELRRFCEGARPTVSARAGLEATRMVMAALRSMDGGGVVVEMAEVPDAEL